MSQAHSWGPWRYDRARSLLIFDALHYTGPVPYVYKIPLDECKSAAGVVRWLNQVAEKTWVDEAALGHLVRALHALGRLPF